MNSQRFAVSRVRYTIPGTLQSYAAFVDTTLGYNGQILSRIGKLPSFEYLCYKTGVLKNVLFECNKLANE